MQRTTWGIVFGATVFVAAGSSSRAHADDEVDWGELSQTPPPAAPTNEGGDGLSSVAIFPARSDVPAPPRAAISRPHTAVALGALGGVAASVLLGALAAGIAEDSSSDYEPYDEHDYDDDYEGLVVGGLVTLTSALVLPPLGAYLAGGAGDGRGNFLGAFLGHLSGTAVGLGLGIAVLGTNSAPGSELSGLVVVTGFAAMIAGNVIGYNLSAPDDAPTRVVTSLAARRERARASMTWTPAIGVDPRGGVMATLRGTF